MSTPEYGMFTSAGNRLIHNRLMTVKRKLQGCGKYRYDQMQNVLNVATRSYRNMNSKKHPEYDDTAVRECFFGELERIMLEHLNEGDADDIAFGRHEPKTLARMMVDQAYATNY